MPELTINPDEIAGVLRRHLEGFRPELEKQQVGRIVEVGDGIAHISGLPNTAVNELLEFQGGTLGLALNLDEESIGAVVLGDIEHIEEGQAVNATGTILSVPVGDALLGRVVNALGQPIDGKGPINTTQTRRLEVQAPGVVHRQPVKEPMQTGVKAIDATTPVGRGQRELIIGDRKTGKTAVALDAIINQKRENVICVYVAIGQKDATVAKVVENLRAAGALDYTIVVVASAADPAPLQYYAPYSGCAMAEYYMYEQGRDTLCVYDDLTKQAAAYRQLSLLMRRPPGREAYPGDIFYAHSRLLERSAKLAQRWVIEIGRADSAKVGADWGVNRNPDGAGVVYVGPLEKEHAEKHD